MENTTLSANAASFEGGGIYNVSGAVTLNNATFNGNTAGSGGGINNQATLNFSNTLIAGSGGGDCPSTTGVSATRPKTWWRTAVATRRFDSDPLLGPLQDNGGPTKTYALLPGSPAIDAGDNATCLATDQRGAARPADGDEAGSGAADCDIGAFESGVIQCGIQAAGEPVDYLFPGNLALRVTNADGDDLDCLHVTEFAYGSPQRHRSLLQTGKYWQIRALTGDQLTAAAAGVSRQPDPALQRRR